MKTIFYYIAAVSTLGIASCTITDGAAGVGDPGGACEELSCQGALVSGLAVSGDALCDAVSDDAYSTVLDCACSAGGLCDAACGDNLCSDLGESADCGDCLNAN